MNVKNMIYLYFRNTKNAFFRGFKNDKYNPPEMPTLGIIHLAFLPITLTLGSGIKTLIDIFSRKPIPKKKMQELQSNLDHLEVDDMDKLINEISKYKMKSKSSKDFDSQLKKITQTKIEGSANKKINDELSELKEKKFTEATKKLMNYSTNVAENIGISTKALSPNFSIDKNKLCTQEEINQITDKEESYIEENKKRALPEQKELIKKFLNNERNDGKKTQHIILNFFKNKIIQNKRDGVLKEQSKSM